MLIRSSTTVKTRVVALAGALLATLVAISLLYSFVYAQGGGQVIEYPENQTSPVHDFAAADPEGVTPIVWTLSGDDAGRFTIEGGVLAFKSPPNYERPPVDSANPMERRESQNVYEVTVEASDGGGSNTNRMDIFVKVTNMDDDGVVTLSTVQPEGDFLLFATLTDEDGLHELNPPGLLAATTWQWARVDGRGEWLDRHPRGHGERVRAETAGRGPLPAGHGELLGQRELRESHSGTCQSLGSRLQGSQRNIAGKGLDGPDLQRCAGVRRVDGSGMWRQAGLGEVDNPRSCADPASYTNPPDTAEITAKRDAGITTSGRPYTIYGDDMNAPREVFGLGTDGVLGGDADVFDGDEIGGTDDDAGVEMEGSSRAAHPETTKIRPGYRHVSEGRCWTSGGQSGDGQGPRERHPDLPPVQGRPPCRDWGCDSIDG